MGEARRRQISIIVGSGFSAALTGGKQPLIGNGNLPTLNGLTESLLSHVRLLQERSNSLPFSSGVVSQAITALERNISRPQSEQYSFEEFLSLLAIESALSQGSHSPILSDLLGGNPQILRCVLFCLAHLFATTLSYDGSDRANRNFWYKVNSVDRVRAMKEEIWHLVDQHDVTFISFNYDGLIEAFLDWWFGDADQQQRGYRYIVELSHAIPITCPEHVYSRPDTRDFARLPKPPLVLKPHGSIHFFQLRPELQGLVGGPKLAAVHPRLDIGFNPNTGQRDIGDVRFWEFADPAPLIVPPLLDKHSYFGTDYFQAMLRLIVEAIHKAERVLVLGFSLPPSDLHVCAAFDAIDWKGKKLGLVFREAPGDGTEMHWKRVAGAAAVSTLANSGLPVDSAESIKAFWRSVEGFLQ